VSYSLYLWHWPVVVFAPLVTGTELRLVLKVVLLGVCVVLAWLTKMVVEDRFRERSEIPRELAAAPRGSGRRAGQVLVALMVVTVGLSGAGTYLVHSRAAAAQNLEQRAVAREAECFGVAALTVAGCEPPFGDQMVPDPASALAQFTGLQVHRECFADSLEPGVRECRFGDRNAEKHVVLLGDSHALQWFPAL
jgi:hypothetical protein